MEMKTSLDPTKELLPHMVDYHATTNPNHVYAEFPVSPFTYEDGYRGISYQDLANAVNGLAWWLQENLGKPREQSTIEVVPYLGPNDMRYFALIVAAVKAGYCVCTFLFSKFQLAETSRG